jgi:hypothetical protein
MPTIHPHPIFAIAILVAALLAFLALAAGAEERYAEGLREGRQKGS